MGPALFEPMLSDLLESRACICHNHHSWIIYSANCLSILKRYCLERHWIGELLGPQTAPELPGGQFCPGKNSVPSSWKRKIYRHARSVGNFGIGFANNWSLSVSKIQQLCRRLSQSLKRPENAVLNFGTEFFTPEFFPARVLTGCAVAASDPTRARSHLHLCLMSRTH